MILVAREFEEKDFFTCLREADMRECELVGGSEKVLRESVAGSDYSEVIEFDGEPAVFWGYMAVNMLGTGCFAWMLSTYAVENNLYSFGIGASRRLNELADRYGFVVVCTDMRYSVTLRWLAWLGFEKLSIIDGLVYSVMRRGS